MSLSRVLTILLIVISAFMQAQNVGINTANPQYRLDIDATTGSTGNPMRLQGLLAGSTSDSILSSSSGVLRRLSIAQIVATGNFWNLTGNSGTTAGTNFIGTTDAQDFAFGINNTEGARLVNSNGHFGVGTTSPTYRLQIEELGGSDASFGLRLYNNSSTSNLPGFVFHTSGGTKASPSALANTSTMGVIRWGGYDGSAFNDVYCAEIGAKATQTWTSTAHGTSLSFNTIANTTTTANTRLFIGQDGNIGMGTTSPTANLHLFGSGKSGFTPTGAISVTGGPELAFSRGLFTKSGTTVQTIDYSSYSVGLSFNVHKGTNNGGGGTFADNWSTDVVQAMTIDNVGNIGVGTVAPNTDLDIDGGLTIRASTTVSLTSDNQAVTVGNQSFLILSSNNGTATSRTFTISDGLQSGQILVILLILNSAELKDTGNCNLASTYALGVGDTITLMWNGSTWYETLRSNN